MGTEKCEGAGGADGECDGLFRSAIHPAVAFARAGLNGGRLL